jgi:hypothetical protein
MSSTQRGTRRSDRPRAAAQRDQRVTRSTEGSTSAVKLSDPAARHDVAALEKKITSSRQQATAFLREVGVLTPTGKLSRKFGGT